MSERFSTSARTGCPRCRTVKFFHNREISVTFVLESCAYYEPMGSSILSKQAFLDTAWCLGNESWGKYHLLYGVKFGSAKLQFCCYLQHCEHFNTKFGDQSCVCGPVHEGWHNLRDTTIPACMRGVIVSSNMIGSGSRWRSSRVCR